MFLACVLALLGCAAEMSDGGAENRLRYDEIVQWSCADLEEHAAALVYQVHDCSDGRTCVPFRSTRMGWCSSSSGIAVTAESEVHMDNILTLAQACRFELRLYEGTDGMADVQPIEMGAECVRPRGTFWESSDFGGRLVGVTEATEIPEFICVPNWEYGSTVDCT
jgi:hypothetical protein